MASNYTEHYQLSQWEAEDAVRRVDFNADNAKIDAAIKAVDQRVDGLAGSKADTSVLDGLSAQVGSLSSSVSSQGSSLSSHASAIARLGNCQVYTGSYVGSGGTSKTLTFPHFPAAVLVQTENSAEYQIMLHGAGRPVGTYGNVTLSLSWSSRSVTWANGPGVSGSLPFTRDGSNFIVIALLDMSR